MNSNERLRALLLTLLMISSVFVGSVALAGSASAANRPAEADVIDVANSAPGAKTTLEATFGTESSDEGNNFQVNFDRAADTTEFDNGFGDVANSDVSFELFQDGLSGSPNSLDIKEVSFDNDFTSLEVELVNQPTLVDGDVIRITANGFQNPSQADDYNVEIQPVDGQTFDTDTLRGGDDLNIVSQGNPESTETAANEIVINQATEYLEDGSNTKVQVTFDTRNNLNAAANAEFNIIDRAGSVTNVPTANAKYTGGTIKYDTGDAATARVAEISLGSGADLKGNATINVTGDLFAKNTTIVTTSSTVEDGEAATTTGFQGERVAILEDQQLLDRREDTTYEIAQDSQFVGQPILASGSRISVYNTTSLEAREYNITFGGESPSQEETLELRGLDFNVTADRTSVDLLQSQDTATIEATVDSNDIGRDLTVRLFDSSGEEIDNQTVTGGNTQETAISFDVSNPDLYTIEAEDADSGLVDSTATITVGAVSDPARFSQSVFSEQRGDIANVTVEMPNTNSADVTIGSATDQTGIGYGADLTVNDTSGDGQVTLQLNTFSPNGGTGEGISLANNDDEILGGGSGTFTGTAAALDAGTYELSVSVNGEEESVSTLSLTEVSADGFSVFTASPDAEIQDADSASEYQAAITAGNLTVADTVASDDLVVQEIEASGLGGLLAEVSSSGDSTEVAFKRMLETGNMNLNVTQAESNTGANRDAKILLDSSDGIANSGSTYDELTDVNVVTDAQNDTYYLAFPIGVGQNTQDGRAVEDGEAYVANLTFLADGELYDENVSVTQTFVVENRSVELDTIENESGEEQIELEAAGGEVVSGETNLAPGSEILVQARATDDTPFLLAQTVEVDGQRNFQAAFDLSDRQTGLAFEVIADGPSQSSVTADALIVESQATATPEPTAEPTATPEVQEPTETPTVTAEPTATAKPGQPGFGIVVALVAILAAALLLLRRE